MVYSNHLLRPFLVVLPVVATAYASSEQCSQDKTAAQRTEASVGQSMLQKRQSLASISGSETVEMEVAEMNEKAFQLSNLLEKAAEELPEGATKSLLHSFKLSAKCKHFVRVGEAHDGGYLICMEGLNNANTKAVYSLGVEQHDKFSDDMFKLLDVPVHQFDCTVSTPAQECPKCHFYQACLMAPDGQGGIPGKTGWTMEEALKNTDQGDAAERSLMMKMDIEGAEWPILSASDTDSFLKKFSEIVIEFHWLSKTERHAQFLSALQHMKQAGFEVVHLHGNNYSGEYKVGRYNVPDVLEVTFVSNAELLPQRLDQELLPADAPNKAGVPEISPAHLP